MAAVKQNIGTSAAAPFIAGDDLDINVTVADLDITGAAVRWEAFPWPDYDPKVASEPSETPVITKLTGSGITITDGPAGEFTVALVAADTDTLEGYYFHEAQIVLGGKTHTVMRGLLFITWQRVV
jgi:hypothetical protein